MGRPLKTPGKPLTERVIVRLDPSLTEWVDASRGDRTRAAFVRETLEKRRKAGTVALRGETQVIDLAVERKRHPAPKDTPQFVETTPKVKARDHDWVSKGKGPQVCSRCGWKRGLFSPTDCEGSK